MRLGHLNVIAFRKTLSTCNVSLGNKILDVSFCEACQYAKQHILTFKSSESKASVALEISNSDPWCPTSKPSNQVLRYYIAFIHDKTNYIWICGLINKS